MAVLVGQHERRTQRSATRDDRHLVQRLGVFIKVSDDGVARLVVGDDFLFIFFNPSALARSAVLHFVAGLFEVILLDPFLIKHGRSDRGFVDNRFEFGP